MHQSFAVGLSIQFSHLAADINGCVGNPCDNAGDTGSSCTDVPAPGTGNTCTCSVGYTESTGVCIGMAQSCSHSLFAYFVVLEGSERDTGWEVFEGFLPLSFVGQDAKEKPTQV